MAVIEEDRVVVALDGRECSVTVSRVGPGRFRVQDFFRFALGVAGDDVPDDAGVGWILEVEELKDGKLRLIDVLPDPDVESRSGILFPAGFSNSLQFEILCEKIMDLGGNWELFAHGLFSAYVLHDRAEAEGFDLKEAIEDAIKEWRGGAGGGASRAAP